MIYTIVKQARPLSQKAENTEKAESLCYLFLEHSTHNLTIVLAKDDTIWTHQENCPQVGQTLLARIDYILKVSQTPWSAIQAIGLVNGPGYFTGIRLIASVAYTLAMCHACPIITLNTLDLMAYSAYANLLINNNANDIQHVITLMDARMQELYVASYSLIRQNQTIDLLPILKPSLLAYTQLENFLQQGWQNNSNISCISFGNMDMIIDEHAANFTQQVKNCSINLNAVDRLMVQNFNQLQQNLNLSNSYQPNLAYVRNKVALTEQERAQEA